MIAQIKSEFRPYLGFYVFWISVSFVSLIASVLCGRMVI